jgi:hypothetical protein
VVIPRQPEVLTQLDGEVFGPTPIEITPAEQPLEIIIPATTKMSERAHMPDVPSEAPGLSKAARAATA